MKITKFTNLTLKPIQIVLWRANDDPAVQSRNVMFIDGTDSLEVKGNINYAIDVSRYRDLRIDTTYE